MTIRPLRRSTRLLAATGAALLALGLGTGAALLPATPARAASTLGLGAAPADASQRLVVTATVFGVAGPQGTVTVRIRSLAELVGAAVNPGTARATIDVGRLPAGDQVLDAWYVPAGSSTIASSTTTTVHIAGVPGAHVLVAPQAAVVGERVSVQANIMISDAKHPVRDGEIEFRIGDATYVDAVCTPGSLGPMSVVTVSGCRASLDPPPAAGPLVIHATYLGGSYWGQASAASTATATAPAAPNPAAPVPPAKSAAKSATTTSPSTAAVPTAAPTATATGSSSSAAPRAAGAAPGDDATPTPEEEAAGGAEPITNAPRWLWPLFAVVAVLLAAAAAALVLVLRRRHGRSVIPRP